MAINSYVNNNIYFQGNHLHGINWEWDAYLPYVVNDIVQYDGVLYRCTTAITAPTIAQTQDLDGIITGTGSNDGRFGVEEFSFTTFQLETTWYDSLAAAATALGITGNSNPTADPDSWTLASSTLDWRSTGRYENNDIVSYNGKLYRFRNNNTVALAGTHSGSFTIDFNSATFPMTGELRISFPNGGALNLTLSARTTATQLASDISGYINSNGATSTASAGVLSVTSTGTGILGFSYLNNSAQYFTSVVVSTPITNTTVNPASSANWNPLVPETEEFDTVITTDIDDQLNNINIVTNSTTSWTVTATRRADLRGRPDSNLWRIRLTAEGMTDVIIGTPVSVASTPLQYTINVTDLPRIPTGLGDYEITYYVEYDSAGDGTWATEIETGSFFLYYPIYVHEGIALNNADTLAYNASSGTAYYVSQTQDEQIRMDEEGAVVVFVPSQLDLKILIGESAIPTTGTVGTDTSLVAPVRYSTQAANETITYERYLVTSLHASSPQIRLRFNT